MKGLFFFTKQQVKKEREKSVCKWRRLKEGLIKTKFTCFNYYLLLISMPNVITMKHRRPNGYPCTTTTI